MAPDVPKNAHAQQAVRRNRAGRTMPGAKRAGIGSAQAQRVRACVLCVLRVAFSWMRAGL
eukprot:6473234-Amphidinium_carterae.1